MFKELLLKNFKGWERTGNVRLAPITLFFGSNSSGKTSLLQSLLLLKQTAESADRRRVLHPGDDESLVDLGTTEDLVFRHELDRDLEFQVRWEVPGGLQIQADYFNAIQFGVRIGFKERGQAVVKRLRYYLDSAHVTMERKTDGGGYIFAASGFSDVRRLKAADELLPPPVRYYGFPPEVRSFVDPSPWLSDLSLALEQQMERIHYVGPLREYPERLYRWAGEVPNNVGTRGKDAVAAILAARNENRTIRGRAPEQSEEPFEAVLARWLARFGVIHSFSLRQIAENRREYEVRVKRTPTSPEVFITDVGFGVSQVLPVLVQSFYAEQNSTIIFEQPEIHLHPRVQADLADVFIDAFRSCGVQFIIESHSEHLLRRLQRRVAEADDITNDDVAIYVCDVDGGHSRIERLKLDQFGNISNWPRDFFGDEVGDLIKMTEAAMRRQGIDPDLGDSSAREENPK